MHGIRSVECGVMAYSISDCSHYNVFWNTHLIQGFKEEHGDVKAHFRWPVGLQALRDNPGHGSGKHHKRNPGNGLRRQYAPRDRVFLVLRPAQGQTWPTF